MATAEDPLKLADIARNCLARKIRQASRLISGYYDEALRPHGIKASQFNILVALGLRGTTSPAELQSLFDLEKSTVSRNVKRLSDSGWLQSVHVEAQRGLRYRLTRKGRGLLVRARPDWEAAEQATRQRLGKAGVAGLDRLIKSLQAD